MRFTLVVAAPMPEYDGPGASVARISIISHLSILVNDSHVKLLKGLSENAHLPFDLPFDPLMALSKTEGLHYPHPSSLRRMNSPARGVRCAQGKTVSEPFSFPQASGLKPFAYTSIQRDFHTLASLRSASTVLGRVSGFEILASEDLPSAPEGRLFDSLKGDRFSRCRIPRPGLPYGRTDRQALPLHLGEEFADTYLEDIQTRRVCIFTRGRSSIR